MRRAARVDDNQSEIVDEFRALGCTVQTIAAVGKGVPDLLVGWRGVNFLVEVKGGRGVLTKDQITWHREWRGRVHVVRSREDARELLKDES